MMAQLTAAVLTVALAQVLAVGSAGHATPHSTRTTADLNTPTRNAGSLPAARVTGLSLVPGAEGAELVIAIDAAANVRDFTLDNPHRIVLDLPDARLDVRARGYDRTPRGPVRDVRLAQFATDTVRVVVELAQSQSYVIHREAGVVRVVISGAANFARWDMQPNAFAPASMVADAAPVTPSVPATPAAGSLARQTATLTDAATAAPIAPATSPVAAAAAVTERPTELDIIPAASAPLVVREITREDGAGQLVFSPKADAVPAAASSFSAAPAPAFTAAMLSEQPMEKVAIRTALVSKTVQTQQKPRITVNLDGTDIRDVIATFAAFSGRTIVVGKDVEGMVTADITDKPWDVALQAILQSQGLAATEDPSGIITVDSYRNLASNQALEPLVTQIVNVNYAKASALVRTVQALLARDCTGLTTMATSREVGGGGGNIGMGGGMGGGGQAGGMNQGQGCVVRGSVASDSATNKLIITEVPTRLPEIINRLQELDVRTPQVAIKAKIIFINRTGIQDIGLAYDLGTGTRQFFQQLVPRTDPNSLGPVDTDGDGVPDALGGGTPFQGPARIDLGGRSLSGIANANNAIKPNALNLIYSTALGRYQLTAFLNALQTSSLADVQSEPSVTILNNRTAEIFVGQEIPIRVIDASAGGAGGQGGGAGGGGGGGAGAQNPNAGTFFPRASVQIKEAGIRLSVTPQVTNNRMVVLDIKAENSNAEVGPSDVGIIFNQQRAESQVLVADGEAAVIGGLTVTEVSRFRSGIPFLMNVPFFGRLFSQNTTNETKRDLLILVTPHILEDGLTPPPGR